MRRRAQGTSQVVVPRVLSDDATSLLAGQLAAAETVAVDVGTASAESRPYAQNEVLWGDILGERLWHSSTVALNHFWISEWLPLCPGRFHTNDAKWSREDAEMYRVPYEEGPIELTATGRRSGREVSAATLRRLHHEAIAVYLPDGKARMLQGGVGCIRLRPRERRELPIWFLGASSTLVAHEGIIVALSQEYFDAIISDAGREALCVARLSGASHTFPPRSIRSIVRRSAYPTPP